METLGPDAAESATPLPATTGSAGQDAVVAQNEQEEQPATVPATAPEMPSQPDDLSRIRGMSDADAALLREAGVTSFAAIAALSAADVRRLGDLLGDRRRMARENWIEQAQLLHQNGETAYSRRGQAALAPRPATLVTAPPAAMPAAPTAPPNAPATTQPDAPPPATTPPASPPAGGVPGPRLDMPSDDLQTDTASFMQEAAASPASAPNLPADQPAGPTSAPLSPVDDGAVAPLAHTTAPPPAPENAVRGLRSVRSEALVGPGTASTGDPDDLKRIRGIGVLIEKRLRAMGYTSYEQIGSWTRSDIDRVNQQLDFHGRIERENWIEQARILAAGGQTEFSRRQQREGGE